MRDEAKELAEAVEVSHYASVGIAIKLLDKNTMGVTLA